MGATSTGQESEAQVAQAQGWAAPASATLLVSDAERDRVVALLNQHWLAGRLSLAQLEQRIGEACSAPDDRALLIALRDLPILVGGPILPPPSAAARGADGGGVASLVCGLVGLTMLVLSFGLLSILSVPLSACAWGLGRSSRRSARAAGRTPGVATGGEVLGIIGTVLGTTVLAGCAALFL